MEEYIQFFKLQSTNTLSNEDVSAIDSLINPIMGISNIEYIGTLITIEYNPYLISWIEINKLVINLGIEISVTPNETGNMNRWLTVLSNKNMENFGSQRLNCCSMSININKN
ncbi:MAG: hypothetical protein WAO52_03480 [Prolixibacteraceae bacterium]